jgi:hypothetical protein
MKRAAAAAWVILGGCSRAPGLAPTPTITVDAGEPPAGGASGTEEPAALAAPERRNAAGLWQLAFPSVVGNLRQNAPKLVTAPSEYCLDDGKLYQGARARVGELNVFGVEPSTTLIGKVVIVYGTREPSLLDALTLVGPCDDSYGSDSPEMQMRSDWVSPEGGFRTTKQKLGRLAWLRASSTEAVIMHTVVEDGSEADRVIVELHNPFDAALDSLDAKLHYEGGPGKPMPMLKPLGLSLPPGGSQRLELVARIEGGPAGADYGEPHGVYRVHSIDLEGTVGGARFEVSLLVGESGARKR